LFGLSNLQLIGLLGVLVPGGLYVRNRAEDEDWLARLLTVEAGGGSMLKRVKAKEPAALAELGGIAWVAMNRSKHHKQSIKWVATTRERGKLWNAGPAWLDSLNSAPSRPAYKTYRTFARRVIWRMVPNLIGPRMLFVHTDTQRRLGRQVPRWIVSRKEGGAAPNEPIRLGRATFA